MMENKLWVFLLVFHFSSCSCNFSSWGAVLCQPTILMMLMPYLDKRDFVAMQYNLLVSIHIKIWHSTRFLQNFQGVLIHSWSQQEKLFPWHHLDSNWFAAIRTLPKHHVKTLSAWRQGSQPFIKTQAVKRLSTSRIITSFVWYQIIKAIGIANSTLHAEILFLCCKRWGKFLSQ